MFVYSCFLRLTAFLVETNSSPRAPPLSYTRTPPFPPPPPPTPSSAPPFTYTSDVPVYTSPPPPSPPPPPPKPSPSRYPKKNSNLPPIPPPTMPTPAFLTGSGYQEAPTTTAAVMSNTHEAPIGPLFWEDVSDMEMEAEEAEEAEVGGQYEKEDFYSFDSGREYDDALIGNR